MSEDVDGKAIYAAPFRERLKSGELSRETYGPASPSAWKRKLAAWQLWTWRPGKPDYRPRDWEAVSEFMAHNEDRVPAGERKLFELAYVKRLGVRGAAREDGVTPATMKTYARRLRARVKKWKAEGGEAFTRGCKPMSDEQKAERLERIRRAVEAKAKPAANQ